MINISTESHIFMVLDFKPPLPPMLIYESVKEVPKLFHAF